MIINAIPSVSICKTLNLCIKYIQNSPNTTIIRYWNKGQKQTNLINICTCDTITIITIGTGETTKRIHASYQFVVTQIFTVKRQWQSYFIEEIKGFVTKIMSTLSNEWTEK